MPVWTMVGGDLVLVCELLRSEKLQNESFPNFSNSRPEFCPEFCSEFSPNFSRTFSCFVSWETETRKNSPKIPAIFQRKIPRQTQKKKIHKILLESRHTKNFSSLHVLTTERSEQMRSQHWPALLDLLDLLCQL